VIDSGVIKMNKTLVSKADLLLQLQSYIDSCDSLGNCDICTGIKVAIGTVEKL